MSNFLPPAEKRLLLHEYRFRIAAVSLYALGALAVVGVVTLVPSFVRIFSLIASTERARSLEEKTLEELGAPSIAGGFRDTTNELAALAPIVASADIASLVRLIATLRPAGVTIRGIAHEPRGASRGTLTLSGTAALRDDLLLFVEALRGKAAFTSVDFPIGDLARERDASFTISVALAEKKTEE